MPANTAPIYTGTPDVQWTTADGNGGTAGPVKTGNAAVDGTAGVTTVFAATTSGSGGNGAYVRKLLVRAVGTNVATVVRIYLNNGSANATAANNVLIDELSLPATTASASQALPTFEIPLEFAIPAGYKVMISLGTTIAAGIVAAVIGGEY